MYNFKAFIFDGKKTASKALDTLEDFSPAYDWIEDVALISKSKHGSVRIHSTWAQDDSQSSEGAAFGALTGGLIGLLLGPAGAAAGAAAGGSIGLVMGASTEIVFDDPKLDEFAESLVNDSSALVLVGDEALLVDFAAAVSPYGGRIIETGLNADDVKALRRALKG